MTPLKPLPLAPELLSMPGSPEAQLRAIDELVATYHRDEQAFERAMSRVADERRAFVSAATMALRHDVASLFETVAARLAYDGGGGLVEERPPSAKTGLRLTLWMSLEGPIATPRQDRHPYLQLDVDAARREIRAWEGDMWRGLGSSRPGAPLSLAELDAASVLGRITQILTRATAHTSRLVALTKGGTLP